MHRITAFITALLAFCRLTVSQDTTIIITTTSDVPTPTSAASSQYTNDLDLRTSILNSTNFFRYEHSAQFFAWNDSLASYAANWANQCQWQHSHGAPGENLARGFPDVTSSVDAWGNERDLYNFQTPTGFSEATGHFTQLVWRDTQTVGCAVVNCNGRNGLDGYYLVCEYWPAGNIEWSGPGDRNQLFEQNVQPERSNGDQGFNEASATIGATGVGTSWASGTLVATASPSNTSNGVKSREVTWSWRIAIGVSCLAFSWLV